jgi:hypothetical protein
MAGCNQTYILILITGLYRKALILSYFAVGYNVLEGVRTINCFFLSLALFVGPGMKYAFGLWQADPIVGLAIVAFLIREGCKILREAESGE